ncbi:MAG TPA: hypothetical protein VF160_06765 [Candidatus Dormibacteraeota bacterium]
MRRILGPGWWLLVIVALAGLGAAYLAYPMLVPSPVHGCTPWNFPIEPGARLVQNHVDGDECLASWEVPGKPEAAFAWYDANLGGSDFVVIDRPAGGGRLGIVGRYGGSQHGTLSFTDAASGGARVDLDLTTEH